MKIYPSKQVADVFTLKPSKPFLKYVSALFHKFRLKKDRDRFMKEFFGNMCCSWKEYFYPSNDHKVVFLMLVNLLERLLMIILNISYALANRFSILVIAFILVQIQSSFGLF